MHRKYILIAILFIQAPGLFSQSGLRVEFQAKPSFGYNIPLTRLLKGHVTDYLLSYDDHSHYWQFLGLTLFFNKHWGAEFIFQVSNSRNISNREDKFLQAMQSEYGNDHYVTPSTGASYNKPDLFNSQRGLLGVIYRLESGRFFFYPKVAIGVTSFYADYGRAYLKEKDANNVIEVYYTAGRVPRDHFTLATSASVGYKLKRWLYLNVDVTASYYKAKVVYTKTTTDLNLKQSTVEHIDYKKHLPGLSVGAGFIISLK